MAKPVIPGMGDLPDGRSAVNQKPFTYTGVDYFGPFHVTVEGKTIGIYITY